MVWLFHSLQLWAIAPSKMYFIKEIDSNMEFRNKYIDQVKELITNSSLSTAGAFDLIDILYKDFENTQLKTIEILCTPGIIEYIDNKRWYDPESPLRIEMNKPVTEENKSIMATRLVQMAENSFDRKGYEEKISKFSSKLRTTYSTLKDRTNKFKRIYKLLRYAIPFAIFVLAFGLACLTDYLTNFRKWIDNLLQVFPIIKPKFKDLIQTTISFLIGNYILGYLGRIIEHKLYKSYQIGEIEKLKKLNDELDDELEELCTKMEINLGYIRKCFLDFVKERKELRATVV